ncbi:MAG: helix-turn-helix domain-containing protein [Bacteroidales bacterium]|nr:helix-turn-helix domain-containing protein [Bacteroidales bacterium]
MAEKKDEEKTLQELLIDIKKAANVQMVWAKELLTPREAAMMMNVSESFMYKMLAKNVLTRYSPGGKLNYLERSEVLRYMKSGRIASEDEIRGRAKAKLHN